MTFEQFSRASELIARMWVRTLPDGREATVVLQMYNTRIVVGTAGWIEDGW